MRSSNSRLPVLGGKMKLRNQSLWLLAGLAVMILMSVGERHAVAATVGTGTGLTITGAKATPVGDPQYEYSFDVMVTASQADPFTSGSSVVITGLNGISPANPLTAAGTSETGWLASFGVGTATFVYYTPPPAPANPPITMDTTFHRCVLRRTRPDQRSCNEYQLHKLRCHGRCVNVGNCHRHVGARTFVSRVDLGRGWCYFPKLAR